MINGCPWTDKPSAKCLLVEGIIVTVPRLGNVFNGYFTSIGCELAGRIPPATPFNPPAPPNIPAFHFPTVTSEYIEKQLCNLPENKVVGLDRQPCWHNCHIQIPVLYSKFVIAVW